MKFVFNNKELYIDDILADKVRLMKERADNNYDNLIIIDGYEGDGKSNLASTIAAYLTTISNYTLDIDNVFFDIEELIEYAGKTSKKIIWWDEAAIGGLSSQNYNKFQIKLIQLLYTARKKNHFYIFIIPRFNRLKEQLIERAIALIHAYSKDFINRGPFAYFTREALEALYFDWKSSKKVKYKLYFTFARRFEATLYDVVPESKYEYKKDKAIESITSRQEVEDPELIKLREENKRLKNLYASASNKSRQELADMAQITIRTLSRWKTSGNDKDLETDYSINGINEPKNKKEQEVDDESKDI